MKRALSLFALPLVFACTQKEEAARSDEPAARIVSPANGDTVGTELTVVMSGQGFKLEKATGTREEGIGHLHLFLDTPSTPESEVIPARPDEIVHIGTGDSTYTYKNLAPGQHEIIVVAAYGDHVPMATRRDTVRFVVR